MPVKMPVRKIHPHLIPQGNIRDHKQSSSPSKSLLDMSSCQTSDVILKLRPSSTRSTSYYTAGATKGRLTQEMKPKIPCTYLLCLLGRSMQHFQSGYTPLFGDVPPYSSFSHSGIKVSTVTTKSNCNSWFQFILQDCMNSYMLASNDSPVLQRQGGKKLRQLILQSSGKEIKKQKWYGHWSKKQESMRNPNQNHSKGQDGL